MPCSLKMAFLCSLLFLSGAGPALGFVSQDSRLSNPIGDRQHPRTPSTSKTPGGKQPADKSTLRIQGPKSFVAGRVYLLTVENQTDSAWHSVDPDKVHLEVDGPAKIQADPALKAMNPVTLLVDKDASNKITLHVSVDGGDSMTSEYRITATEPTGKFQAVVDPTHLDHKFAGLGGGVLFYDNQFEITSGNDLYDWCFRDVKTSILHLLIRPECEPNENTGDWHTLDPKSFDFASAVRPLKIAREALKRNPALKIYASVYSPPVWMKTNASTQGTGSLKDGIAYRRQLAKFIYAWLLHAQDEGVPVNYLAFFNEPDWQHTQDGMHFDDLGQLADTFVETSSALKQLMEAEKTLKVKPLMVFPDALGPGSITRGGANSDKLKARSTKLSAVDIWGVHDYWNTSGNYWPNRFRELRAFPGVGNKPIWLTEWAQRERHGDLQSGLDVAGNMLNALRLGAEAWMIFEWAHPYGNQAGLISTDWGEQNGQRRYWRSKAYHMFRQIANTTPAGSNVISITANRGGAAIEYLGVASADKLIVHLLNSSSSEVEASLRVHGMAGEQVRQWQTTPFDNCKPVSQDGESRFRWESGSGSETAATAGRALLPPYSLTTIQFNVRAAAN